MAQKKIIIKAKKKAIFSSNFCKIRVSLKSIQNIKYHKVGLNIQSYIMQIRTIIFYTLFSTFKKYVWLLSPMNNSFLMQVVNSGQNLRGKSPLNKSQRYKKNRKESKRGKETKRNDERIHEKKTEDKRTQEKRRDKR